MLPLAGSERCLALSLDLVETSYGGLTGSEDVNFALAIGIGDSMGWRQTSSPNPGSTNT